MTALGAPSLSGGALTVSDLNAQVAALLHAQLPMLRVRGEAQGIKRYASGHVYFTLKDEAASVSCVMFKMRAQLFDRLPREGELIELRAKVSLYEPRGDFQLKVDGWQAAGQGALYEAFLQRKALLEAEGLLDTGRKRALPIFARRIGIVTSPQAAVLRDVATALVRRAPHIGLVLYPSSVQGAGAGAELAAAVQTASRRAVQDGIDVLLVCRGGGSMEDLWCFNDEALARAVAACSVPVISGVGHETDVTLCDFVADMRAPTPTAAAELAASTRSDWQAVLQENQTDLCNALAGYIANAQQTLDRTQQRLLAASPQRRLNLQRQQLAQTAQTLRYSVQRNLSAQRSQLVRLVLGMPSPDLTQYRQPLTTLAQRLEQATRQALAQARSATAQQAASLNALNPQRVLERGYAVVLDRQGQALTAKQAAGTAVAIQFAQGRQAAVLG